MRRTNGTGDDVEAPRQTGTTSRKRPRATDEDEDGCAFSPGDIQDNDCDQGVRREIRSRYRDLINTTRQEREEMVNISNNRLTEVLDEANKIFKDVKKTREAALDAQFLVLASDMGKEKCARLFSEGTAFDPTAFSEHLLSFMGLNRLVDGEDERQNGGVDGYLPQDAWLRLARRAECCFRTAPSFHFMRGSFLAEPPPPKPRVERQRQAQTKEAKRIMPTALKKMDDSRDDATVQEVERIFGYLRRYHQMDPTSPILYYEFVIDPKSFSRTVENIFHTSFLIRDGLVRMYLDGSKLPCLAPVEEGEIQTESSCGRKQGIVSISPKRWQELIDAFTITDPMIQPHNTKDE